MVFGSVGVVIGCIFVFVVFLLFDCGCWLLCCVVGEVVFVCVMVFCEGYDVVVVSVVLFILDGIEYLC